MYLSVNASEEMVRQKARLNNLIELYRVPDNIQICIRVVSNEYEKKLSNSYIYVYIRTCSSHCLRVNIIINRS